MKTIFIVIAFGILYSYSASAQKYAALTFDDAPDSSYTDILLDILDKENVKATFFVLGSKVEKNPDILKRIDKAGHLIGNHSTSHTNFLEYKDSASLMHDVFYTDSVIFATIGKKPHYLRPPYGRLRVDQKQLLQSFGYEIALWTLSTKDWDVFNVTKESIVNKVKNNIHNNAVILLHSKNASEDIKDYPLRNNTIEALPEVIKFLKENDYNLVTLDKINPDAGIGGDDKSLEEGLKKRDDILFYGGFEENFGDLFWAEKWGINWEVRADSNKVVSSDFIGNKSLKVKYTAGGIGPLETGSSFPIVFRDIPKIEKGAFQEVYLRYYIKFEDGFDFRKGGKLPGLMGGGDSWTRSGGNQPVGDNGWTLRFMWLKDGKAIIYAYVPKSKNGKWGKAQWGQTIDCGVNFETEKWHCIEQFVNVGSPNKDDGQLKVWIDGVEKVNIDDMRFWDVENDDGLIGGVYFSTFHGGNTKDWAPLKDSYMLFDGFVVAKNRVGIYEK